MENRTIRERTSPGVRFSQLISSVNWVILNLLDDILLFEKINKYTSFAEEFRNREKIIGTTMILLKSPIILEYRNREKLDFVLGNHMQHKEQKDLPE